MTDYIVVEFTLDVEIECKNESDLTEKIDLMRSDLEEEVAKSSHYLHGIETKYDEAFD